MNITVLGTGAYGLALAIALNKNSSNNITMWTKIEEEKKIIDNYHEYKRVLPNVHIPENIKIETNLEKAISNTNLIICAIPVAYVRNVLIDLKKYYNNQPICIATKGIEQKTNLFINEIIKEVIDTDNIAIISGASFAIDTVKDYPIGLTLATTSNESKLIINEAFNDTNIKIENTNDLVGTEICGSIKNIIAIGCGILSGLNANESTKAMFIKESIEEINTFINLLNGSEKTILTYAGIADLLLTCTSSKSRNYSYGETIATKTKEEIEEYENNTTIEGRYTLKSIIEIEDKNNITSTPIIRQIYEIIYNKIDAKKLFEILFK